MQAFWLSFATNPDADPRNHIGQVWPRYTGGPGAQVMDFGNATGAATGSNISPVSVADGWSGPCV